ncbi:MAG: hypothetical protein EP343_24300 [Deltaproteobacteria bacterium]|nr:MAG: hypothetical protein EP343_24300 [Deltaproteobacteria bacterium]
MPQRAALNKSILSLLFVLVCCSIPTWTEASEGPCRKLFQAKKFGQAATCYQKLFDSVDPTTSSEDIRVLLKDRYLRQGAVALFQQAQAQTNPAQQSYILELAIKRLSLSLKEGYCKASRRCLSHKQRIAKLRQQIQYTDLIVTTRNDKTIILVEGYKYKQTRVQNFQEALRPGEYTLTLRTPGRKDRVKTLKVRGNRPVFVNVTPVQVKIVERRIIVAKKIPPLVLTGYIAGSLLVAAGAGLLIYGVVHQASLNARLQNPAENANFSDDDYFSGMQQGQTIAVIGSAATGLGVIALASGAIAHAVTRRKPQPPKLKKSVTMGVFGR